MDRISALRNVEDAIRAFEDGYLTRVIHDDHGIFVTTDPLTRDRFEELAAALHEELRAIAD